MTISPLRSLGGPVATPRDQGDTVLRSDINDLLTCVETAMDRMFPEFTGLNDDETIPVPLGSGAVIDGS